MKNARTLLPAMLLACLLSSCAGQAQPSGPARPKPLWAMSASDMFPNDPKAQALALAAGKGDIKEIDRLVAQGADVNVVGDRGLTIPYWVLYHPSDAGKKGFKRLLELGADPNKIRLSGKSQQVSLVHWTAYLSSQIGTDYLRMALEIGKGDPNLLPPDGKVRPIEMALTPADTEAFIVLYNAGAEINYKNKYGHPLVYLAASDGNYEIVLYLLQHGVDYISEYNGGGPKNIQDDINIELKCAVVARYPDVAQYMWFWRSVDFLEKRGMVFDFTPDRNSKPAVRPATLDTTPPLSGLAVSNVSLTDDVLLYEVQLTYPTPFWAQTLETKGEVQARQTQKPGMIKYDYLPAGQTPENWTATQTVAAFYSPGTGLDDFIQKIRGTYAGAAPGGVEFRVVEKTPDHEISRVTIKTAAPIEACMYMGRYGNTFVLVWQAWRSVDAATAKDYQARALAGAKRVVMKKGLNVVPVN